MDPMVLSFFDQYRNEIMVFENFRSFQTETLDLISFNGKVNFDFFHLETNFEAEKSDFENLKDCIEKIYDGNKKYATFCPLAGKILIQIREEDNKINFNCDFWNDLSNCKLSFHYQIDRSFLPEQIGQLRDILCDL